MIANLQKNKKGFDWAKNAKIIFLWGVLLTMLMFLAVTNIRIYQRREKLKITVENIKKEIEEAKEKNKILEDKIQESGEREYLEKIAREQYNLKAPGEEVAVVVRDKENASADFQSSASSGDALRKSFFQKIISDFKDIFNYFSRD